MLCLGFEVACVPPSAIAIAQTERRRNNAIDEMNFKAVASECCRDVRYRVPLSLGAESLQSPQRMSPAQNRKVKLDVVGKLLYEILYVVRLSCSVVDQPGRLYHKIFVARGS
jgi:hypothetical protein